MLLLSQEVQLYVTVCVKYDFSILELKYWFNLIFNNYSSKTNWVCEYESRNIYSCQSEIIRDCMEYYFT